ncbi:MAG: ribonuclease H-like domain-containing protein [Polyangiaceae bacterium]
MRSLRQKLADLPSPAGPASAGDVRREAARGGDGATGMLSGAARATRGGDGATGGKPTLEELREKIAALVGHREPARPRADPSAGELPFFVEQTALGPRYVRRVRAAPAARVGRAPLVAARDADAGTLGLLALDPAIGGCDPRKALYLDTETTGLAGGTGTVAFLVGLAFFDEAHGVFVLEQMLLRRLGEEAPILELVHRRMAEASMVVTYNGKTFDVPLLRTRFVMNRMAKPKEPPHLDLLHVARRVHKHRLTSCTLSAIENEVLGRGRVGDVSGMDIVEAYAHFLRSGDEAALHGVVTHNEHDVLAMVALLGLYGEPFGVVDETCAGPGEGSGREDLAGVARTLHRAGATAGRTRWRVRRSARGGAVARRVSADILRARGKIALALQEYEAIVGEVDDPEVRLLLAKLYEHKSKAYERALSVLAEGTTESATATRRRRDRLERKLLAAQAIAAAAQAPRAGRRRSNGRRRQREGGGAGVRARGGDG